MTDNTPHLSYAARCAMSTDLSAILERPHDSTPANAPIPVSEPLTQHATRSDLSIPSNQSWHNVPFALADDGVLVYTAILDVSQQNIAIIGAYGSGKTNLLLHCARWLYDTGCANIRFTRKTEHGMVTDDGKPLPSHKRTIWIVDDADEALNPFSSAPEANELREALVNPNITVIAAVEKPISALLDRCPTRVAFPCGERSNDLMLGIPGAILDGFAADDYTSRSWRAHATGQSMPYSVRGIPRFLTIRGILFAKTLESRAIRGYLSNGLTCRTWQEEGDYMSSAFDWRAKAHAATRIRSCFSRSAIQAPPISRSKRPRPSAAPAR